MNKEKYLVNENIATYIYRIQAYKQVISRYFCIGFIDFMEKSRKFIRLYEFILYL